MKNKAAKKYEPVALTQREIGIILEYLKVDDTTPHYTAEELLEPNVKVPKEPEDKKKH